LRIQKAALALGPKATIEQIALEAFMTVGAVYLYFRSRDELIASLSELVQEDV
jgi:AcrR family transcriptional regulator